MKYIHATNKDNHNHIAPKHIKRKVAILANLLRIIISAANLRNHFRNVRYKQEVKKQTPRQTHRHHHKERQTGKDAGGRTDRLTGWRIDRLANWKRDKLKDWFGAREAASIKSEKNPGWRVQGPRRETNLRAKCILQGFLNLSKRLQ